MFVSNRLAPSVPSEVGSLFRLQSLALDHNELTGSLPPLYMENLTTLYLHSNQLSGKPPPNIMMMSKLVTLYIQSNEFSGKLTDLFNATTQLSLQTIDVGNNQFAGDPPSILLSL